MCLLLLGCAPVDPEPPSGDTAATLATPPAWSAEDVGAQFERVVTAGIPEPWTLNGHYLELIAHGDVVCPGPDNQMVMPEGTCVSESGYAYYGVATWWDTSTEELTAFYMFTASFVITPPEEAPFQAGGSFRYDEYADGTWSGLVEGVFVDEGQGGWLASEPSSALQLAGTAESVVLHGGVTTDDGVVWFDSLTTCDTTAAGDVRVRAPEGDWYTLSLDPDCSGCGQVTLGDQDLGEVCVDIAGALQALQEARTR
jgi:hypothetical protein